MSDYRAALECLADHYNQLAALATQDAATLARIRRIMKDINGRHPHLNEFGLCNAVHEALEEVPEIVCPSCLEPGCEVWGTV